MILFLLELTRPANNWKWFVKNIKVFKFRWIRWKYSTANPRYFCAIFPRSRKIYRYSYSWVSVGFETKQKSKWCFCTIKFACSFLLYNLMERKVSTSNNEDQLYFEHTFSTSNNLQATTYNLFLTFMLITFNH